MFKKLEYKYLVAIIYVSILFLDRMDLTITNVAMPTFAKDFQISITDTDWIATSFLIALGVVMPVSGWLSDRFGSKKTFLFANCLFILSSTLCACAWGFSSLIFFRVLQGIGGGLLVPVGMSMTYRAFEPREYPKLANYTLIPTLVAPSIAPAIGGFILEHLSWHWIFLLHFPLGILSIFFSFLLLKEDIERHETSPFDWSGFFLLASGLSSLFFFLSRVGVLGIQSFQAKVALVLSVTLLTIFVIVQLQKTNPLLKLRFFKIPLFSQAIILQILMQICYFGSLFLIAVYFQTCVGMTPLQSGLSMTGQSVGTICMLFFSSKLFQKYGPKYIMFAGFVLISIFTLCLLSVTNTHEILLANLILWSRGLSIGLINGPLQACAMLDLKKQETSSGSALFNVLRQIGISLGVALSCMVLAIQFRGKDLSSVISHVSFATRPAFQFTFILFAFIALLGALVSLSLNNKRILTNLLTPLKKQEKN